MMETIITAIIHAVIYMTFGSLFVRIVVSPINRKIRAHRARVAYINTANEITLLFENFIANSLADPTDPST